MCEVREYIETKSGKLKAFAMKLTKDEENAADLFQEVCLKALVKKEQYKATTNVSAWMHRIMYNTFVNNYRLEKKTTFVQYDELIDDLIPTDYSTPLELLSHKHISVTISKLKVHYRTLFMLYVEGHKYEEIASMHKLPLGTVKSRIHVARQILQKQLANDR